MKNMRTRLLLFIGAGVVVVGGAIGLWYHHHVVESLAPAVQVGSGPSIASVPGSDQESQAYVQDQNTQNQDEYHQAVKQGGSTVPTITRPSFIGNLSTFDASHHVCPMVHQGSYFKPDPAACTTSNLTLARKAGVNAEELRCQNCACPNLKAAGFNASDLKAAGFSAKALHQCGFSLQQLIMAGFSGKDLKDAGFSAAQLKAAGFTAAQLRAAGFSAKQLKAAGFTAAQLKAAGFNAAQLKAAGFSAKQLKAAGFSAADLEAAGFSPNQLKAAGFTAAQLQAAGLNAGSLAKLKAARAQGISALALKDKGDQAAALEKAGYTAAELRNAGFSAAQLKRAGFGAKQLRAAGFDPSQLKSAGFTAAQLNDAGYTADELKASGFDAKALQAAGFTAADLKNAGFSAADLKNAGFNAAQLNDAGFNAADLKTAGFGANALHDAGFAASDLKDAGFAAGQLKSAGFSAGDLMRAGYTPSQLGLDTGHGVLANPCSLTSLMRAHAAGLSATALADEGCSAKALHAAGYSDAALKAAGFNVGNPATDSAQVADLGASATVQGVNANPEQQRMAKIQQLQAMQATISQRREMLQQMQGQMQAQAQQLLAQWSQISPQQYAKSQKQSAAEAARLAAEKAGAALAAGQGPVLKAGDVFFAVLTTGINSDEPSPIMAKVVSGELKGAKLLGQFHRENDKVIISFSTLSLPSLKNTVSINAVAIDSRTAHTAVSGSVDNHYLLRYGSLFASSFISGYANAITNAGSTIFCLPGSACSQTQAKLNPSEKIAAALGNVGTQYANTMSDNFNTPPTVKIRSGTGIGILLMGDLQLPANAKLNQRITSN